MDYGIRISYDAKDVKTCADRDCVLTSKQAQLKGTLSGSGTVTFFGDTVVEVTHGLGYIPIVRLFLRIYDGTGYQEVPTWDTGSIHSFWDFQADADTNKAYLRFIWYSDLDTSPNSFDYKYLIFLDKGNV